MAERGRVIPNGIVWHGRTSVETEEQREWVGSPDPEDFTVGATYDVTLSDCCVPAVEFRSKVVAVDPEGPLGQVAVRWENGVVFTDVATWGGGMAISLVDDRIDYERPAIIDVADLGPASA